MRRLDGGDELSDGLVAFWPLDEAGGNSFFDISRYGNHGRGVNGPARRTGRNGVATLFDGADDYVSVPAKSPVNLSRAVSLSVWINPAGWGESNFGRIIDKDNGGNGWAIYLDNSFVSSGLGWRFGGTTGSLANCITLNVWQHVLVTTPDANNFYVFVNGVLRGSGGGGAGIGTTTTALAIGNRGSDTARAFNGQMANLRLWNKPRWIGEARRLANDPWAGTLRELRRVWYLPSGGYSLALDNVAQEHAVGAMTFTLNTPLSLGNVAHEHSVGDMTFTLNTPLALGDVSQEHAVGDMTFTLGSLLTLGNVDHEHAVGDMTFTRDYAATLGNVAHEHAVGNMTFAYSADEATPTGGDDAPARRADVERLGRLRKRQEREQEDRQRKLRESIEAAYAAAQGLPAKPSREDRAPLREAVAEAAAVATPDVARDVARLEQMAATLRTARHVKRLIQELQALRVRLRREDDAMTVLLMVM